MVAPAPRPFPLRTPHSDSPLPPRHSLARGRFHSANGGPASVAPFSLLAVRSPLPRSRQQSSRPTLRPEIFVALLPRTLRSFIPPFQECNLPRAAGVILVPLRRMFIQASAFPVFQTAC